MDCSCTRNPSVTGSIPVGEIFLYVCPEAHLGSSFNFMQYDNPKHPNYWQHVVVTIIFIHIHLPTYIIIPPNQSVPAETILIKASLTAGTDTKAVAQTAVRTILIAANGNASFSGIMAATPNP